MTVFKIYPHIKEPAAAARFIGAKVADLRSAAKTYGPGIRLTGKQGRSATFLGAHPDTDYMGTFWWEVAQ